MASLAKVECDTTYEAQLNNRDVFKYIILYIVVISLGIIPLFLLDSNNPNKIFQVYVNGSSKYKFQTMDIIRKNAKKLYIKSTIFFKNNNENFVSGQFSYNTTLELSDQTSITNVNQKSIFNFQKKTFSDTIINANVEKSRKYAFEINYDFVDIKIDKIIYNVKFDFASGVEHTIISLVCLIIALLATVKFIFQFQIFIPNIHQIEIFILSISSMIVTFPFFKSDESFIFNSFFFAMYNYVSISILLQNRKVLYISIFMCWISLLIESDFTYFQLYTKSIWIIFIFVVITASFKSSETSFLQIVLSIVPPTLDLLSIIMQRFLVFTWQKFMFTYWPFYIGFIFRLFLSMPKFEKSKEIVRGAGTV